MSYFSDSPYEKMMTERPAGGTGRFRPSPLSPEDPCWGCGNYTGMPCVGPCQKELNHWLNERRNHHETGHC